MCIFFRHLKIFLWVKDFILGDTNQLSSWKRTSQQNFHYNDVVISAIASQITSLTIVYSPLYSGADQRKHQSSASLALVPVNSPQNLNRNLFVSILTGRMAHRLLRILDDLDNIVTIRKRKQMGQDDIFILSDVWLAECHSQQERQGRCWIFDTGWSH